MIERTVLLLLIGLLLFLAVLGLVWLGWPAALELWRRQRAWYERVLVRQLLVDIDPRTAAALGLLAPLGVGVATGLALGHYAWFVVGAALGALIPFAVVRHLELVRRRKLDRQLIDGVSTMASGVRAGLNLVQSMQLLVHNGQPPIRQEFGQLLREYQMGLDMNQAMRHAANRIGSSHFRLLFTALEMHRIRGGDVGDSLDRIGASIREIQRLEGKLDAVTASGRFQAMMIAVMPLVLLGMRYLIDPDGVRRMFTEPLGRMLMLIALALIVTAFLWIRRIMDVDI